jgi:hypothetical protein
VAAGIGVRFINNHAAKVPEGERPVLPRSLGFRLAPRLTALLGALPLLAPAQPQPSAPEPATPPQAAPQPPPRPPPPVSGKVLALSGHLLTLGTVDHGAVRVTLGPDTHVVVNRPGTLADVRAGAFIGTTAVEGADRKLRATEVHVFPEALRGTGEGHYPWGTAAATTMTNGNVRSMTNGSVASRTSGGGGAAGVSLDVTYKGGQTQVEVAPDVPVVVITLTDESSLAPGTQVLAFGPPDTTGGMTANLVAILPPPPAAAASSPAE